MNYYEKKAVSNSFLGKLSIHPQLVLQDEPEKKAPHFDVGSAVDVLLTTPKDFDLKFYEVVKFPTDAIRNVIEEQ